MPSVRLFAQTLALALATLPLPALADEGEGFTPECLAGICQLRVTPAQLLAQAEALVNARRFGEAAPIIEALRQAPETKFQSRFLAGYAASLQGDYAHAAGIFKDLLGDNPKLTRVRLELARAMLAMGQTASADRQFAIAQADGELPPDVARAIRGAREVIRSRRTWRLDIDFGLAPDSNINNATGNDSISVQFGDTTLPINLGQDAQATSGLGQTGLISAGLRLPVSDRYAILATADANGTNYKDTRFDDYLTQATAGAELRLASTTSFSLEAIAAQRWFGGKVASRQVGARVGMQLSFGDSRRLGAQLDVRSTTARFDSNFSGTQAGLYVTAEQVVAKSFVASLGGFARRDWLKEAAYSNMEVGATIGFGGELPLGISFGLGGTLSRATYDAPMGLFSPDPRKDWRYSGRLTVGNRKVRVFGFSPQLNVTYNRNDSSLPFFATDRLRARMSLARYF